MSNDTQPEIRFPGFTEDWEQRKLTELATTYIGLVTTMTKNYTEYGTLLIRNSDIKEGKFDLNNPIYLKEDFAEQNKTRRMRNGDVVTVHTGDIGTSAVITEDLEGTIGFATITTRPSKELDSNFLSWYFNSNIHKKYARRMSTGDGRSNYNMKDFNKNVIAIPKLEEQQKIGTFFKQLDDTITLHQSKLDLLKETKKGFLQKMFPKNGAKVPEIRFPGFTEDWEQSKLGQVANYRRGSFPQPYGNKEWYDGENSMPFVQVVDVGDNLRLVEDTKQKISELAQPKSVFVEEGKVVVTLQGSIGRVAITQYPAYVDRTLLIFENYKAEMDEYYFAYVIQQLFEYEKTRAPGGTIKTITKEALSNFTISFPSIAEQKKLGKFFEQLDDTIALHQRKLDLLKETKKGFLQKMFV